MAKQIVYIVKYRAENGEEAGQRFTEKQRADAAAASLKRTGKKGVRIVTRRV